ncbi:MAG: GNAT family N-acetyltransferase [Bdellovibrionales bacterium]|nr:GNAT family N-acetyltransferase [Bdellovibrionales bacterium]
MTTEKNKLPKEYRFVELPNEDFQKLWNIWGNKIFKDNDTSMDFHKVLSETERSQIRELFKNLNQLVSFNLCIYKGDEFCGWFIGDQYNNETFYMRNSAILPDHRRKGLYTALMYEILERAKNLGFQVVLSRHTTTNNSIIIPKLKAGFVITALEISDRFGTLVHLSYFFNEKRKKVMQFRSGDLKPDDEVKSALRLD